ncbi:hypothetical protein N9X53_03840 [Mariniblastus sp.]|nr:hypothetical protein [Mariniblastus sp.]
MQKHHYSLLVFIISMFLPSDFLFAQWTQVKLPNQHPEVFALAAHNKNELVIGTGGLPNSSTNAMGILWSNDHGDTITQRSNGILNTRFDRLFRSIISVDGWLIAASADGVYFSNDSGKSWEKRSNGLPIVRQTSKKSSNGLTSLAGAIFCGTPAGVFKTTDLGKTWVNSSNGLSNPDVRALTSFETTLIASTDGAGIYTSSDAGNLWTEANHGIPANVHSRAIIANDKTIFAGTNRGTYRSTDLGKTWSSTLGSANARSFAIGNGLVAAGAFRGSGTVYISSNNGDNWFDASANLPRGGIGVWAMAIDDKFIYAAVNRQGLWRLAITDFEALQKKGGTGLAKPAAGQLPEISGNLVMQALDENKDGKLSTAELNGASLALASLDKNQDGQLTPSEMGLNPTRPTPMGGMNGGRSGMASGVLARLKSMDTNGDGILTKDEIPGMMQRIIDRADTNLDGALDNEEIEAFTQQLRPGGRN